METLRSEPTPGLPVIGDPALIARFRPDLLPALAERWQPTIGPITALRPIDWQGWAPDALARLREVR